MTTMPAPKTSDLAVALRHAASLLGKGPALAGPSTSNRVTRQNGLARLQCYAPTAKAPLGTCSFRVGTRIQRPLSVLGASPTR